MRKTKKVIKYHGLGLVLLTVFGCENLVSGDDDNTPDSGHGDADSDGDTDGDGDTDTDADTDSDPSLADIDDLTYVGAFRLPSAEFGVSSTNYAVGTLGYNPSHHSLFIAGHAQQNAIAEFAIPQPGTSTPVTQLPLAGDPLQPFVEVLETGGNPEGVDRITGMLWLDGALIVNAEQWYDAAGDNVDTTLLFRDSGDLLAAVDGYFELNGGAHSAGYMGPIPSPWQDAFGAKFFTGWSSVYSIVSRYSVGPSLWTFAPADLLNSPAGSAGPINAIAFMNYAYEDAHLSDRAVEYAAQGETGPFPPASPLWNILSRGVYGFIIPGTRTFAVIGSNGGIETGIGYKAVQDNGNLCGGPCAYGSDDYYNYYWFFDLDEILGAENVSDPRPYNYGIWEVPFDDNGSHKVIGATVDSDGGMLYVALEDAGQVGDYDRPPLIIVFALP